MILLLTLVSTVAFGNTIIPSDYIQVTPTNATEHGISFSCGTNSDSVTIYMPFTNGEFTFDDAVIDFTNSGRHFRIPIKGMKIKDIAVEGKKEQDMLLLSFWMDRQTLRETSLTIYFRRDDSRRFTVYVILPKDFLPKEEASPKK